MVGQRSLACQRSLEAIEISGRRSLEAMECKYNKNELLLISAIQVASLKRSEMERADNQSRFLTAIFLT